MRQNDNLRIGVLHLPVDNNTGIVYNFGNYKKARRFSYWYATKGFTFSYLKLARIRESISNIMSFKKTVNLLVAEVSE